MIQLSKRLRSTLGGIGLFLALVTMSAAALHGASDPHAFRKASYQISSRGFRVGELKSMMQPVVRDGQRLVRFEANTSIDAGFLFFALRSISYEEALVGEAGTVGYRRSETENGRTRSVEAQFFPNHVTLIVREVDSLRMVTIPRAHFDFTTMDCPEATIVREGEQLEIRLLDLAQARVVTRRYRWLKTEAVTIGRRTIHCRIVDFEDSDDNCRRWIARDGIGVIIARQEGQGKSGSYVLQMTSLEGG